MVTIIAIAAHAAAFRWLGVASDGVIALVCFLSPLLVAALMRNRMARADYRIVALAGTFVVLCGSAHVSNIVDVRHSGVAFEEWLNAAMAAACVGIVAMLVPALPRLLRLPNPRFDALTHIPHRGLLVERIQEALRRACRSGVPCAVFFVDLDRFKAVNDVYGHATGDAVLVAVARRLSEFVRASGIVGRLGGDEFVVCVERVESAEDAFRAARHLANELELPYVLAPGQVIHIGASIGVALSVPGSASTDAARLIADADRSMYREKDRRRAYDLPEAVAEANSAVA
jgi:diguanylate cyclase (GGDEF)-like protein